MNIGLVKEIKNHEYRVALRPSDIKRFVDAGHNVSVCKGAGENAGFTDNEYISNGAKIISNNAEIYKNAELIIKVKEPIPEEYQYFRPGLIFYCFMHLAAEPELAKQLIKNRVHSVAYETITDDAHGLPCLAPMSAIAGRIAIQSGSKALERTNQGRGVLLGGVPGTPRAHVTIIGGGVVGANACKIAIGMGARVTVLDIRTSVLNYLDDLYLNQVDTLYSSEANIEQSLKSTDLLVGALLVPGATAPKIVKRKHLSLMPKGSVIVDVAIDQGGCTETSKPTSHQEPIYIVDNVLHYCVTNMPGCVPRTSSVALANTTCNFAFSIANDSLEKAIKTYPHLKNGLNTYDGKCTSKPVADSLGLDYKEIPF